MTLGQLVARLVRDGLDRYDPSRPPRRRTNRTPAAVAPPANAQVVAVHDAASAMPAAAQPAQDRAIPAATPASAANPHARTASPGCSPSKAPRDPDRGATSAPKRREPTEGTDASPSKGPGEPDSPIPSAPNPATPVAGGITSAPKRCATIGRVIPAGVRRQVWERDQGCCSYEDPVSGRRCGSRHLLQVDHIFPYALGGGAELQNLRLLCFAHHRLRHAARVDGERRQREGPSDIRRTA